MNPEQERMNAADDAAFSGTPQSYEGAADGDDEVGEIRESIEHTRADMSATIDELQERLSPSYIKEQVKEQVIEQYEHAKDSIREATIGKVEHMVERFGDSIYETRRGMVETVSANPIPSALVAIGLAWLWMNRRSDQDGGYRSRDGAWGDSRRQEGFGRRFASSSRSRRSDDESWTREGEPSRGILGRAKAAVGDAMDQAGESASDLAGKARERVSGVIGQAQEAAGQVAQQAQYQAARVEDRFNSAMQDNPLAVGAAALAIGTAVGLVIPETQKEHKWMGEARDTFIDKAQAVASDVVDKVQQVADKVAGESTSPAGSQAQGPQTTQRPGAV